MRKYQVVEDSKEGDFCSSCIVCTHGTWEDAIKAAERYNNLKGIAGAINSGIHIVEVEIK